jgi:hypothetical protein
MRPILDPRLRRATWLVLAIIGWTGLAWIAWQLASQQPPRAGDDLRVLVEAAQRIVAGEPLYTTVATDGSLQAESLFYSYPPPVAQALVPVSGLPFEVVLLAWGIGAMLGLGAVAGLLSRPGRRLVLPTVALAPYTVALAVALLFGNLNAWFPLAFGLVLAALLIPGRGTAVAGGAALGMISIAKLHPASLVLWLVGRGLVARRASRELGIAVVAATAGLGIVGLSLFAGGTEPWAGWVDFLRSGAATSDLVSPLNIGPASQLALLLGLDDGGARTVQVIVTLLALGATLAAAWLISDDVASFGWASAASLVILPVTWIHYAVALIPVAIGAAARTGRGEERAVGLLLGGAFAAATVALAAPVLMWIAVVLVLAAAHRSAARQGGPA